MEVVETSGLISIHETGTITNYLELIREYHGSLNQLRAILDSKSDIIDKLREEIKILKEEKHKEIPNKSNIAIKSTIFDRTFNGFTLFPILCATFNIILINHIF